MYKVEVKVGIFKSKLYVYSIVGSPDVGLHVDTNASAFWLKN